MNTEGCIIIKKHPTLDVYCLSDGRVIRQTNYKIVRGCLNGHGYRYVQLRGKNYMVHRLIAETFIPNHENKPTVDHINRIREDNRVCNLRWATHTEQRENSAQVIDRMDFGVRSCENRKEYNNAEAKLWYSNHKDYRKEYMRAYYQAHKDTWNTKRRKQ